MSHKCGGCTKEFRVFGAEWIMCPSPTGKSLVRAAVGCSKQRIPVHALRLHDPRQRVENITFLFCVQRHVRCRMTHSRVCDMVVHHNVALAPVSVR